MGANSRLTNTDTCLGGDPRYPSFSSRRQPVCRRAGGGRTIPHSDGKVIRQGAGAARPLDCVDIGGMRRFARDAVDARLDKRAAPGNLPPPPLVHDKRLISLQELKRLLFAPFGRGQNPCLAKLAARLIGVKARHRVCSINARVTAREGMFDMERCRKVDTSAGSAGREGPSPRAASSP